MAHREEQKLRVAIYCRVACENSDVTLLDLQKEMLRNYAKQENYRIVAEIGEVGSGLNMNRSGLNQVKDLVCQRAIDAILTKDFARIGRDYIGVLNFEEELRRQNIAIITLDDQQDMEGGISITQVLIHELYKNEYTFCSTHDNDCTGTNIKYGEKEE